MILGKKTYDKIKSIDKQLDNIVKYPNKNKNIDKLLTDLGFVMSKLNGIYETILNVVNKPDKN